MTLMDRLTGRKSAVVPTPRDLSAVDTAPTAGIPDPQRQSTFFGRASTEAELSAVDKLKVDIHHRLIARLDLEALEHMTDEGEITSQIRLAVADFLRTEVTPLSQAERDEIVEHVVWEVVGLGPIEPFFRDPTVSDILVNNARNIFVERNGRLARVPTQFRNDAHLLAVI
ncbi:MAG: hypothetical protein IPP90_09595, partial [Gemmatimonadaceae bacterium]|nr:hypothetical protein [Gemmatimonadaceae bacterium]